MSPEENGSSGPQGGPVESVIAEVGTRPAGLPARGPEPVVEVERRVIDRTPVSQLTPAMAREHFDTERKKLQENPRLVDDVQFMQRYGALAALERGANVQPVLEQDLSQLDPYGRLPSPGAERIELTSEQWALRLGSPRADLGDEGPAGDWDAAVLNQAEACCQQYGLPNYTADAFAKMEVALAHQRWTEADARRHLVAEHGPEKARELISNADYMLKRMARDPWLRARIEHWEGETGAGLNHPVLIATLAGLVGKVDAGNPHWAAVDRAVLEEEAAAMRAQQAEREAQAQKAAQERDEAVRALQRQLRGSGTADAKW